MIDPMPAPVASAAARLAAMAKCRAIVKSWAPREAQSLPARTWASIDARARTVLVMLGATQEGEPRKLAAQSWDAFSIADQCSIAAVARELSRELRCAASLF